MKYQTYTKEFIEEMLELNKTIPTSELRKIYNIPRTTFQNWKKYDLDKYKNNKITKEDVIDFLKENREVYSYILGLYLGDGYINKPPRTYRLRIYMDNQYQELNNYVIKSLKILFPNNKIKKYKKKNCNVDIINVYSNSIKEIFPQHGLGRKHERKIELQDWQKEIISPTHFIQGLFHSDGSYYISQKKYENYSFTNKSLDIKNLFIDYCKMIDVNVTFKNLNFKNIYVYKDSKKLKELIGTKTEVKDIL